MSRGINVLFRRNICQADSLALLRTKSIRNPSLQQTIPPPPSYPPKIQNRGEQDTIRRKNHAGAFGALRAVPELAGWEFPESGGDFHVDESVQDSADHLQAIYQPR